MEDMEEITQIQQKILETCSKYLKKNGEIVYATCSIFCEENEKIIEKFLQQNQDFDYVKIENIQSKKGMENSKYIQLYQGKDNDGFFICKLQKK